MAEHAPVPLHERSPSEKLAYAAGVRNAASLARSLTHLKPAELGELLDAVADGIEAAASAGVTK